MYYLFVVGVLFVLLWVYFLLLLIYFFCVGVLLVFSLCKKNILLICQLFLWPHLVLCRPWIWGKENIIILIFFSIRIYVTYKVKNILKTLACLVLGFYRLFLNFVRNMHSCHFEPLSTVFSWWGFGAFIMIWCIICLTWWGWLARTQGRKLLVPELTGQWLQSSFSYLWYGWHAMWVKLVKPAIRLVVLIFFGL